MYSRRVVPAPPAIPPAPQTTEWGPAIWKILHSLAEKSVGTLKKNIIEEKRLWFNLLNSLRYSLPCPNCRKHYNEYYITHLIDKFIQKDNFNKDIRLWLYNLHCEANKNTGKDTVITIEELTLLYSNYGEFRNDAKIFVEHMQRALFYKWIIREDMQKTLRFLYEIMGFYSV
jgi:hypothetical protein